MCINSSSHRTFFTFLFLYFFFCLSSCKIFPSSETLSLTVSFLNVGQGDAQIIQSQNTVIWIDVGNDTTKIKNWLLETSIDTIDIIIITHPDLDHYGSLNLMIKSIPIKHIILPHEEKNTFTWQQTLALISSRQIATSKVYRDNVIKLNDQTQFHFLWPTAQTNLEGNNLSYVIQLLHGNNRILFTGDIEQEAEFELLNFADILKSTILKVAHHGSSSSSSLPFLNAVQPKLVTISSDSSVFGHPHTSTLQKLLFFVDSNQIYRTDTFSDIIFQLDLNQSDLLK